MKSKTPLINFKEYTLIHGLDLHVDVASVGWFNLIDFSFRFFFMCLFVIYFLCNVEFYFVFLLGLDSFYTVFTFHFVNFDFLTSEHK